MSLHRRLEKLEVRRRSQIQQGYQVPRHKERYWHAFDNARRKLEGLESLPDLEYTEEDRRDDLRTLDEHIPAMRAIAAYRDEPGWQTEEGEAFLDQWERATRERL